MLLLFISNCTNNNNNNNNNINTTATTYNIKGSQIIHEEDMVDRTLAYIDSLIFKKHNQHREAIGFCSFT